MYATAAVVDWSSQLSSFCQSSHMHAIPSFHHSTNHTTCTHLNQLSWSGRRSVPVLYASAPVVNTKISCKLESWPLPFLILIGQISPWGWPGRDELALVYNKDHRKRQGIGTYVPRLSRSCLEILFLKHFCGTSIVPKLFHIYSRACLHYSLKKQWCYISPLVRYCQSLLFFTSNMQVKTNAKM